jgi:hypothetical protein
MAVQVYALSLDAEDLDFLSEYYSDNVNHAVCSSNCLS